MKAAEFLYERPSDLGEALRLLGGDDRVARVLAGGQSLGPMLNLRLATPQVLVDVTRIDELRRAEIQSDAVVLGACVTHAAIEDRLVPDPTRGIMPGIAAGIAYRAVRNRGTLGGSLAHADPAADWVVTLAALGAQILVAGGGTRRRTKVADLIVGPFETSLVSGEIIEAVHIPKLSPRARWGFCKVSRKAGKFADAMAAVLSDPEIGVFRAALGALESRPVVIDDTSSRGIERLLRADYCDEASILPVLEGAGVTGDRHALHLHFVALKRAMHEVRGR